MAGLTITKIKFGDDIYSLSDSEARTQLTSIINQLQNKADKSEIISATDIQATYATKAELATKADAETVNASIQSLTAAVNDKVDKSEYESDLSDISTALEGKANATDVYTKAEANAEFAHANDLNDYATTNYVNEQIEEATSNLDEQWNSSMSTATINDTDTQYDFSYINGENDNGGTLQISSNTVVTSQHVLIPVEHQEDNQENP